MQYRDLKLGDRFECDEVRHHRTGGGPIRLLCRGKRQRAIDEQGNSYFVMPQAEVRLLDIDDWDSPNRKGLPPQSVPGWLLEKTFVVEYNPNCNKKWLVRLVGTSGRVDQEPLNKTRSPYGAGDTMAEAADLASIAQRKQEEDRKAELEAMHSDPPKPSKEWPVVDDPPGSRYRYLKLGELISHGDQFQAGNGEWHYVTSSVIGRAIEGQSVGFIRRKADLAELQNEESLPLIKDGEPLSYEHVIHCNCSRELPIGSPGCVCLRPLTAPEDDPVVAEFSLRRQRERVFPKTPADLLSDDMYYDRSADRWRSIKARRWEEGEDITGILFERAVKKVVRFSDLAWELVAKL